MITGAADAAVRQQLSSLLFVKRMCEAKIRRLKYGDGELPPLPTVCVNVFFLFFLFKFVVKNIVVVIIVFCFLLMSVWKIVLWVPSSLTPAFHYGLYFLFSFLYLSTFCFS